jgi:O-antigen/teichoic acid export membrane protein
MSAAIEIKKSTVAINAASSVLRKALVLGVLVWSQQYLMRRNTPDQYTLLPTLNSLLVFLPLLSTLVSAGLRRYVTEAYARGESQRVTELVSAIFPRVLLVAGLMLVAGGAMSWYVGAIVEIVPEELEQARIMFFLLVLSASLRVACAPFGIGFDLRQKFLQRNVISLGAEVLRVSLMLALLAHSPRVLWVVVASLGSTVVELVVVNRLSRRLVPELVFRPRLVGRAGAAPMMRFGGWSVLNQVSLLVREAADPLILNRLANSVEVNSFWAGALFDRHIRATFLEASATAQPAVTAMQATDQAERLRRAYFRVCRYSLWILFFFALPMIVYREELMAVWLRESYSLYASAAVVMALLLSRAVVIFPNSALGMVAVAKEEVRAVAVRACIVSSANLALTFYLVGVHHMGAVGSALATWIVTFIGAPTLNWPLGLRLTGSTFGEWWKASVWPGLQPGLAAAPVWIAMHELFGVHGWLGLVVHGLVGAVAYVAVLVLFAASPAERADFLRFWRARGRAPAAR